MKKQLEKRFSFKEIENEFINEWDNKNIFKFKNYGKKNPFCIMMPPQMLQEVYIWDML